MAIRLGDWKMVLEDHNAPADTMLFNLSIDKGERVDVYQDNSEKVNELRALFKKWEQQLAEQQ